MKPLLQTQTTREPIGFLKGGARIISASNLASAFAPQLSARASFWPRRGHARHSEVHRGFSSEKEPTCLVQDSDLRSVKGIPRLQAPRDPGQ